MKTYLLVTMFLFLFFLICFFYRCCFLCRFFPIWIFYSFYEFFVRGYFSAFYESFVRGYFTALYVDTVLFEYFTNDELMFRIDWCHQRFQFLTLTCPSSICHLTISGVRNRHPRPGHRLQLQDATADLLQRGDGGGQKAPAQPGPSTAAQDCRRQVDQDDRSGEAGVSRQVRGLC